MTTKKKQNNLVPWSPYVEGVTQSLLVQFLHCPELCRLGYGLRLSRQGDMSPSILFGSVFHELSALVSVGAPQERYDEALLRWKRFASQEIMAEQAMQEVLMAELIIPMYFQNWTKDKKLKWIYREQNFSSSFPVPGFKHPVVLRGRWDGVFQEPGTKGRKRKTVWLHDTKTKSMIDEVRLDKTLAYDFQMLFYLEALHVQHPDWTIKGFIYDIVRRPGLRRKKTEPLQDFLERVRSDVLDRPSHYFLRYHVSVQREQVVDWRDRVLVPALRALLRWYEGFPPHPEFPDRKDFGRWEENPYHYINPDALNTRYGLHGLYDAVIYQDYSAYDVREHVHPELEEAAIL